MTDTIPSDGVDVSEATHEDASPEINWDAVEIPVEVIRQTPEYQNILNESITRRKVIKDLKSELNSQQPEPPAQTDQNEPTTNENDTQRVDDLIAARFERMENLLVDLAVDKEKREATSLVQQYKLTNDDGAFLLSVPAEQREALAKRLAKKTPTNTTSPSGGGDSTNPLSSMEARVAARISGNLMDNENPFDVGVQTAQGGGAVIRP